MSNPVPLVSRRIPRRRFLQAGSLVGMGLMNARWSWAADSTRPRRVSNVNTTDIAGAVKLACRTMGNVFNEADHNIPFFASWVTPDANLAWNPDHSEAHVPGRHLNALLHAEAAWEIEVPDEVIAKHQSAAFFSYSGALPFPLNRRAMSDAKPTRFLPHNLREGFHALYALTRFRKSEQARKLAEASIQAILELWHPDTGWNREKIEGKGVQLIEWQGSFITGIARAIGPLVKFYRATQYGPALELALLLKSKALKECFLGDGSYDLRRFGTHTHSTTCTLSSLAQLAALTADAHLMDRIKAFCERGLGSISDGIGWSIENNHPDAAPDRGECNNTGDILETALLLGQHGYPEYYQFAERILRCHLLPSQLRDISFIKEAPRTKGGLTMAERHLGAFGFPAPYGHAPLEGPREISFNMDIVGGATDSLCAVQEHISRFESGRHTVQLLFDRETEALKLTSPYQGGPLQITLKKPGPLFVRMPPWVERAELSILVPKGKLQPRFSNGYCFISQPPVNEPIQFAFKLKESEINLQHRTRNIRVRMKGDSVAAMQSFNADLVFFQDY